MDPLGLEIWMLVMAAFSVACFTLFALARFSPYEWRNPRPWLPRPDYLVNQFSLANSFWFITGTLLRQGSGVNPKVAHPILAPSEHSVLTSSSLSNPFFFWQDLHIDSNRCIYFFCVVKMVYHQFMLLLLPDFTSSYI
jgi:hypothetical protein